MKISGFTFIHNAIDGGLPIVEAIKAVQPYVDEIVVVDMQSTDRTREVLEWLEVRIVDGRWDNRAGETLDYAFLAHTRCDGDIIIYFEADEVYDDNLVRMIVSSIECGVMDMAVYRIQLEQNFQRCRWYPELVHRVFPRHSDTCKRGHTTTRHDLAIVVTPDEGYLWDISNCFRDNWLKRIKNQAKYRNEEEQYLMTPLHILHKVEQLPEQARIKLGESHWTWDTTPFNIPQILKPLVGKVKYEPRKWW